MPGRQRPRIARELVIGLVLGASTLVASLAASSIAENRVHDQTNLLAKQLASRIRSCVQTRIEMVEGIRRELELGGYHAEGALDRRVGSLIELFPGYLAVNRISADGEIVDVHPGEPNRGALGRKISDNATAWPVFQAALATGTSQMTAPVELFQRGTGVAVYVPTRMEPPTVLNAVFRAETLLGACLGGDELPDYAVDVHDGEQMLFSTVGDFEAVRGAGPETEPMSLLNRTWRLRLAPARALIDAARRPARMIALVGLVLSALLTALLAILATLRARARETEERSEQERARLVALVNASSDFIAMTHRLDVVFMNPVARQMTGTHDLAGLRFDSLVVADDQDALLAHVKKCETDGAAVSELRLKHRDSGVEIPAEVHSSRLEMPTDDKPALIATVARDLRERRRFEARLQQTARMEVLGRLSGGLAHDFNNMLTVITTGVHMLLEDELPPDSHAVCRDISDASARAAALVRELLALQRGGDGSQMVEIDVGRVVQDMRSLLARVTGEQIRLTLEVTPAPAIVRGAKLHLEQIIMNLATNAVAAMPDGGTLTIAVVRVDTNIELTVSDTGVGMPPDLVERVFEPFFTTKPVGEGTGLGLATVQAHAQHMGGSVTVCSAPGAGATFVVSLPAVSTASQRNADAAVERIA